jgi:hypothetical protein
LTKFTVTLIVVLCVLSHTAYSKIISPKIIQNDNRVKEVFTSRAGMEGWAWVSFLVDVDGKPKDIVVLDYSGKERYIKRTINYVKNLTFSPTLFNGVLVISEKNMFLPHTFSGVGYSAGTVTPVFLKKYQKAIDVINSPKDIYKARILIDNLKDDHTKNLEEHALVAWLESIYYYKNQDFLEYIRQSQITLKLHKYLPLKILSRAVVNLFEAQLHYGYYAEAKQTLNSMREMEGLKLSEQVAAKFHEQLKNKMEFNLPIQVKGKLTALGGWVYKNTMQKFKITQVNGIINSVELRCIGFYQKYTQSWQVELEIPQNAENCVTLIQGQKGTTFDLVQIAT